jgi:WW domain-containing oxidoreductase
MTSSGSLSSSLEPWACQVSSLTVCLQDQNLASITVTGMDPSGLIDSRAHMEQRLSVRILFVVVRIFMPILKYLLKDICRSSDAAKDLVDLAVGEAFEGHRGYYLRSTPARATKLSEDEAKQAMLWNAAWRWTKMKEGSTCLDGAS